MFFSFGVLNVTRKNLVFVSDPMCRLLVVAFVFALVFALVFVNSGCSLKAPRVELVDWRNITISLQGKDRLDYIGRGVAMGAGLAAMSGSIGVALGSSVDERLSRDFDSSFKKVVSGLEELITPVVVKKIKQLCEQEFAYCLQEEPTLLIKRYGLYLVEPRNKSADEKIAAFLEGEFCLGQKFYRFNSRQQLTKESLTLADFEKAKMDGAVTKQLLQATSEVIFDTLHQKLNYEMDGLQLADSCDMGKHSE